MVTPQWDCAALHTHAGVDLTLPASGDPVVVGPFVKVSLSTNPFSKTQKKPGNPLSHPDSSYDGVVPVHPYVSLRTRFAIIAEVITEAVAR